MSAKQINLHQNSRQRRLATPPAGSIKSIDHVIILAQENRSFDNYLGALREYWAENGIPDQSFDGLPQFNPTSGAAPLQETGADEPRM